MLDEPPPRNLPERTGKHYCIRCLAEVPADEYFRNDQVCEKCAEEEQQPEDDEQSRRHP
ncbi:MAG TPA: hypothetical protein VLV78_22175 [Thermoanaerobaculia bacterium]|nr:hypothetical protein [Thermoanaerobaculia bacterium]